MSALPVLAKCIKYSAFEHCSADQKLQYNGTVKAGMKLTCQDVSTERLARNFFYKKNGRRDEKGDKQARNAEQDCKIARATMHHSSAQTHQNH